MTSAAPGGPIGAKAIDRWGKSLHRQLARDAQMPSFLVGKLCEKYPMPKSRDAGLTLYGLRQFFIAHLHSGRKFVATPSKIADGAWHEFILHTRANENWCGIAVRRLLHHSPAEMLGRCARRNDHLRRSWYRTCHKESIDPKHPLRLPLLFALDKKFNIAGGFNHLPDCRSTQRYAVKRGALRQQLCRQGRWRRRQCVWRGRWLRRQRSVRQQ